MAPANLLASLGTTSSERDSTGLYESPSFSASAEDPEPAPLLFHELCLKMTNSTPNSYPPSTLAPSMGTAYWLNRQRCLENNGHLDTNTKHYPEPDTLSCQGARPCIPARTLHKMTTRYPDLTSRPGSVLNYVAGTDVRRPRTVERREIELVAAQRGRPEITLTGCEDGMAGPEMDILSWEALGRPRGRGLLVYCEGVTGRENACLKEGGCGGCRSARRMNERAMRAFGVGVVDGLEAGKAEAGEVEVGRVEEHRGKGGEVVVMGKIRKMGKLFGMGEGGEKRKEMKHEAASEKYKKMQERNIKKVNERRKKEERKAEKKAKDLAKRISRETLKKEAKSVPGSKLSTPSTS